ncbi:MAG: MBG domain-containing protein [Methylovulum sp.]|nr:MBG domain-containing protein [Methylovulum sp.]
MKSNRQQPKHDHVFFGAPLRRALNLAILAIIYPPSLLANPDGAQIINGQVSIDTSSPGVSTITNSPNAIIQWQNFNIAQNEITQFIQQNSQSAVLNRIVGENPSAILGQLFSNGKVLLINPNGIVFGANTVIDTQGLIASSLNLSNEDFLNGNYHFIAGSNAGNIVNEGIIRAGKNGNIILIAPTIKNNGIIKTEGGQITLAAGQKLVLTNLDDPDIRFEIQAPGNAVLNLGKLLTEGGAVNVFANTITHSGEINADSVTVDAQGHIKLVAEQAINLTQDSKLSANNSLGDAGTISIESKAGTSLANGVIEANATGTGKGGNITLLGEHVSVQGQASIDASGALGGGQIVLGGDKPANNSDTHLAKTTTIDAGATITADATSSGDGGKVRIGSDNATRAYGRISAKGGGQDGNGGTISTSGHWLDTTGINVDASASHGKGGEWQVDADNINIQAESPAVAVNNAATVTAEQSASIVTSNSVQSALNNGTSVTVNATGTNANGNITVSNAVIKNAGGDAALKLSANNNIMVDASVVSSVGKLDLAVAADADATDGGTATLNKTIALNSGTLTLHGPSVLAASGAIKNATLMIPDAAATELNGSLSNVDSINIDPNAQLTINRSNASFDGLINNHGTLTINAYFAMNALNLDGGVLSGSGAVKVNDTFNFYSGVLDGAAPFITAAGSTTNLATAGTAYLGRQWNNLGTINWQGEGEFKGHGNNSVLNNGIGGVFNIGNEGSGGSRELDMTRFNNQGGVNLYGGMLKVLSSGTDKGSYQVSGDGQLQFWSDSRNFVGNAAIDSANTVTFANGVSTFGHGSSYHAPNTEVISFGTLNFNTGTTVNLASLTLETGSLGGSDAVNVNSLFAFHSGSLNGKGLFTTTAATSTTLADKGTVYLNKNWDNLGTITWQGIADVVDDHKLAVFNNAVGGIFNIGSPAGTSALELNTARFNNHGTVNLSGGLLKIVSPGADTGSYHVSGNGELQFWYGARSFENGASVDSANKITFSNGKNSFRNGSSYHAGETDIISEAVLNFSTGNAVTLSALTIDRGTLGGTDAVNISDSFNFQAGVLNGSGTLTTAAGSVTTLADKDTVYLGKTWDNLGTVSWQGHAAIRNPNSGAVFNNLVGGIFNISNADPARILEIASAKFNNLGTVNLDSGILKIFSNGTDTGRYNVTGTGQLQFWNGTRNFNSGATVDSVNTVAFVNGKSQFNQGANYNVDDTLIDNARVTFNTGNTIVMPMLTIDNSGSLAGSDALQISKILNFYSGFMSGGRLTTQTDSKTLLTEGIALLNKDWDNHGTVTFGVPPSTDLARTSELTLPTKFWNNYGTIFWQGAVSPSNDLGKNIVLTNKPGGLYNISSDDPSSVREINIGAFNNQGTLNLSGGILKIFSPGTDTGAYNVTGTGRLEFRDGARAFSGAAINSANSVTFGGGSNLFNNGAIYNAPETVINDATVSFNSAASLGDLVMSGGLLNTSDNLTVNGTFYWSGGTLSGNGAFNFNNGFNYTAGSLLATGTVTINDTSGSLSLPAMPSIKRLRANSAGDLILNGDIIASGQDTAIALMAANRFDNSVGATLSAVHGRWLVYSETPSDNSLGGLTADFKHYGCTTESCNNGFSVADTVGNGLLYQITPVLTVTPDSVSSIYGNQADFSSTYTGFIDGDTVAEAGISGNAHYANDATSSSSGNANVGTHNIAYADGLASKLGYQFKDNSGSSDEWTITPRDLSIAADAKTKGYGQADPLFTYLADGLVTGDTLSGALSRIAGEDAGRYAITLGSLSAGTNYTIGYTAADLTIHASVPPEQIQQQITNQQNEVQVSTKPDTFTLGSSDNDTPEPETTVKKPLKQCK